MKNKWIQNQGVKKMKFIWIVVLSFCATLAFSLRLMLPELSDYMKSTPVAEIIWNLKRSFSISYMPATILFFTFIYMGFMTNKIMGYNRKPLQFVAIIIAIIWLMGDSFGIDNTLAAVHATPGQVVKSLNYIVGMAYIIYQLSLLILYGIDRGIARRTKPVSKFRYVHIYEVHPFLVSFFAIFVCWLPYIVAAYPGYTCTDAWSQLVQFFGIQQFTASHPPIHTICLGLFIQFGLWLGNSNLGLYLFIVFQVIVALLVLAYVFSTMKKLMTPLWLRAGSFCVVVTIPHFTNSMVTVLKDTLYSYMILLFMVEFVYILKEGDIYFNQWKHKLLLAISIVGGVLFRNNGKYVLYPTIIIIFLWICMDHYKKKKTRKEILKKGITLFSPILIAAGIYSAAIDCYHIESGSIREMLSLPFQQTARYVLEYGNEITPEEAVAISAVLDYESLAEIYEPVRSAAVMGAYRENATTKELFNYFRVWIRQFFKHPQVYMKATINQNYYLIYPFAERTAIYGPENVNNELDTVKELNERLNIHEINSLKNIRYIINGVYRLIPSLPMLGLLTSIAFYNLVFLFLFINAWCKKMWKWILLSVPIILSNIVVFLAPLVHARYAFPIFYSMPIAVAYYIYSAKEISK